MSGMRGTGRCKFYDENGNPGPTGGCRKLSSGGCRFVHPGEPGWATAQPPPPHSGFSYGGGRGLTGSNGDPLGSGRSSGWPRTNTGSRHSSGSGRGSSDSVWGAGPGLGSGLPLEWGSSTNKDSSVSVGAESNSWGASVPNQSNWGAPTDSGWGAPAVPSTQTWGAPEVSDAQNWASATQAGEAQRSSLEPPSDDFWGSAAAKQKGTKFSDASSLKQDRAFASSMKRDEPRAVSSGNIVSSRDPPVYKASDSAPTASRTWGGPPKARKMSANDTEPWDPSPIVRRTSAKDTRVSARSKHIESTSRSAKESLVRPRWGEDVPSESEDGAQGMVTGIVHRLVDMDVDDIADENLEKVTTGHLSEWATYLSELSEAVHLQRSLEGATSVCNGIDRLRRSERFRNLKPGHAAFERVVHLSQIQKAEASELRIKLQKVVHNLPPLPLPSVASPSSAMIPTEQQMEEVRIYLDQVKAWLAAVETEFRTNAGQEVNEEETLERVAKLEDKLASLEEYVDELRRTDRNEAVEYLSSKLAGVQDMLAAICDLSSPEDVHDEIQNLQSKMKLMTEQFYTVQNQFHGQPMRTEQETNINYKTMLEKLQKDNEVTLKAFKANEEELKILRGKLEDVCSAPPPTRLALPVVTQDDILFFLLPLLREQARADFSEACGALHEGVAKALIAYQDQLSAAVWDRLQPVLQFAHSVQQSMDTMADRRTEQAFSRA